MTSWEERIDAVWADDFHHAIHSRLTGEKGGYYSDFAAGKGLPRALAEGFAYQGEVSEYFGRARGTASTACSRSAMVEPAGRSNFSSPKPAAARAAAK